MKNGAAEHRETRINTITKYLVAAASDDNEQTIDNKPEEKNITVENKDEEDGAKRKRQRLDEETVSQMKERLDKCQNVIKAVPDSDTATKETSQFAGTVAPIEMVNKTGPTARWGHSMCMLNENEILLIGGQGDKHSISRDALWNLDLARNSWSVPEVQQSTSKPESRMGHSAVYDPLLHAIYLYGGSKHRRWFRDVHMLDIEQWKWEEVKASGNAPVRAYHSCTLFCHELWIFGGVFSQQDPEPDKCSDELFVFSPIQEGWYTPLVMGTKPQPRSGHSATLVGNQLVIFGGWDSPICFNDLHILDMSLVEWRQPKINSEMPSPRSWHSSCVLSGNQFVIHGGYNGNHVLDDTFIFDFDSLMWTQIQLTGSLTARAGHTALYMPLKHDAEYDDEIVVFGGGDNEGNFYQDLVKITIPRTIPRTKQLTTS